MRNLFFYTEQKCDSQQFSFTGPNFISWEQYSHNAGLRGAKSSKENSLLMSDNSKIVRALLEVLFRSTFLLIFSEPFLACARYSWVTSTIPPMSGVPESKPPGEVLNLVFHDSFFTILHEFFHTSVEVKAVKVICWKNKQKHAKDFCIRALGFQGWFNHCGLLAFFCLSPYYVPGTVLSPWLAFPLSLLTTTLYGTIVVSIL